MISPDTAMTIFLPTVLAKKAGARITDGSQGHRRHRLAHRIGALRERRALVVGERHLEDLLEPGSAQLARHAKEYSGLPVLTLQPCGTWQNALLIERDRFAHLHDRRRRRVERRARLQILHDLGAAVAGAIDDRVELRLVEQLRDRNAADRRVREQ